MKTRYLIITILFGQVLCAQKLNVVFDTLEVNVPGSERPWIIYKNYILAYFNSSNPYNSGGEKQFYMFDINSSETRQLIVPEELQTDYFDLYIRNDSVFTTEYDEKNTYFLDFNTFKWVRTRKGDDLIYEDENYYVTSLDFGEWGGCTWFIDKKSGQQFELALAAPLINKVDSGYVITSGRAIYLLKDPKSLDKSDSPYLYKKVVGNQIDTNLFPDLTSSMKGLAVLFEDTTHFRDAHFYITTAFIQNYKLYFLCVDSGVLCISQLKKGKLESVFEFSDSLSPTRWNYHYRNRIENNVYQSLQFATKDAFVYGIFDFNEFETRVIYVKNRYRIPVLGNLQIDSLFYENFRFFIENLDSLYLSTTDSLENRARAIDITPSHKMNTSLKPELVLESPKCFQKVGDSLIVMETMYYYTVAEKKVEIINFKWKENTIFETGFSFIPDQENESYMALAKKYESIKTTLIKQLGKPISESLSIDETYIIWKTDEFTVTLYSSAALNNPELKIDIEVELLAN